MAMPKERSGLYGALEWYRLERPVDGDGDDGRGQGGIADDYDAARRT